MGDATHAAQSSTNGRADVFAGAVAERVASLRERSHDEPRSARDDTWDWIAELRRRAATDRLGALAELQQMFLSGRPARGISGQTEGLLVSWTIHPRADKLLGALTDLWMPWQGKKFFPDQKRGVNTLTRSARLPAKLVWPRYSMGVSPLGHSAFDFTTRVEAGELDPSVEVLVIDYAGVKFNPRMLIRQIRDELVELVPGASLGKMLVRVPGRRELFPALYFALRSEV